MTRYYLARLTIEGFRGINNQDSPLDLQFKSDAVNSIWAPNGFGKSSIYDALCFAIQGTVPKLDQLHTAEKGDNYYNNRFHTGSATILLRFASDDQTPDVEICVERAKGGQRLVSSPSGHPDPQAFLRSLDHEYALLDYNTFSKFIHDTPLVRGRYFSSLIGLAQLSKARQALERLAHAKNLESDYGLQRLHAQLTAAQQKSSSLVSNLRIAHQRLLGTRLVEPVNHAAILGSATVALAALPLLRILFEGKDLTSVDFDQISKTIKEEEGGAARSRLAEVLSHIESLKKLAPQKEEGLEQQFLSRAIAERDEAVGKTKGTLFQTMYKGVQDVLLSGQWATPNLCPACESEPFDAPADYVAERLKSFEDSAQKQQIVLDAWPESNWVKRLKALEGESALAIPERQRKFALFDRLFHGHPSRDDLQLALDHVIALEATRISLLTQLCAEKELLEKELPPSLVSLTEQVQVAKSLRDALQEHSKLHAAGGPLDLLTRKIQQRKRWTLFIKYAAESFGQAEGALSAHVLQQLADQHKSMYRTIICREEVVPALVKKAGSEDLLLKLEQFFDQKDLEAQPLLAESARNAFAIAVFLSAALKKSTPPRFVVLDDITSSFDAGHQWHLMELLRQQVALPENKDGLQVIILSHDGLLEKYFDAMPSQTSWHHQKLLGCPPTGSVLNELQQVNRLRAEAAKFLMTGQTRQAEPLLRQYLEFKLIQIIRCVQIPVPLDFAIRDDRHMVGNCVQAINAAIAVQSKAGSLILDSKQHADITKVHTPSLVANWMNHYETSTSSSIAPAALLGVLQTIDAYADCFMFDDKENGVTTRRYYKSLEKRK